MNSHNMGLKLVLQIMLQVRHPFLCLCSCFTTSTSICWWLAYCTGLLLARRVLKKLELDSEYEGNVEVSFIFLVNIEVFYQMFHHIFSPSGYWRRLLCWTNWQSKTFPCFTWCWPCKDNYRQQSIWCSQGTCLVHAFIMQFFSLSRIELALTAQFLVKLSAITLNNNI